MPKHGNQNLQNTRDLFFRRPGYLFRRCQQVSGHFGKKLRGLGLTQDRYDVLFALTHEETIGQDELANLLGLDRSTTGVVVKGLMEKGFVSRSINPNDRRKLTLALTDSGREIFHRVEPLAMEASQKVLGDLSVSEREQLLSLLRRIIESRES